MGQAIHRCPELSMPAPVRHGICGDVKDNLYQSVLLVGEKLMNEFAHDSIPLASVSPENPYASPNKEPETPQAETKRRELPLSLIIVAILFSVLGFSSAANMLNHFLSGSLHIDIGILNLFIAIGLLRKKPVWRTTALVVVWIGVVLLFVSLLATLALPSSSAPLTVYGPMLDGAPWYVEKVILFGFVALMFAAFFWILHVLTRPDVRELFRLAGASAVEVVEQNDDTWHGSPHIRSSLNRGGSPMAASNHNAPSVPQNRREESAFAKDPRRSDESMDDIIACIAAAAENREAPTN